MPKSPHSWKPVAGTGRNLEVLRFEFDLKNSEALKKSPRSATSAKKKESVRESIKRIYPHIRFHGFQQGFRPGPEEQRGVHQAVSSRENRQDPMALPAGPPAPGPFPGRGRNQANGAQKRVSGNFLRGKTHPSRVSSPRSWRCSNVLESVCDDPIVSTSPTSYTRTFSAISMLPGPTASRSQERSDVFMELKRELYNTQILGTENAAYTVFVQNGLFSGEDASLVNAFIAFCQTTPRPFRTGSFQHRSGEGRLLLPSSHRHETHRHVQEAFRSDPACA